MFRHAAFLALLLCLAFGAISCSTTENVARSSSSSANKSSMFRWSQVVPDGHTRSIQTVRTTAYSHQERDSWEYGTKSATGDSLKYGSVIRSAAADWSVYPVGTLFRIIGEPHIYEVDDYGSALVGTKTIDIYKPTMSSMRAWGVRNVNIEILRWGSYERSLVILQPRTGKAAHVRSMVRNIEGKI